MDKTRKHWADVLKGIGAIFVVAGHLVNYNSDLKIYIYSFHMPLFFFISGYLYQYQDNIKKFGFRKIKSLLCPYFLFGLLSMVISFLLDGNVLSKRDILKSYFFFNGSFYWNSSLWFLIIMFFVVMIFQIYMYGKKHMNRNIKGEEFITFFIIFMTSILFLKYQVKLRFGFEIVPHCLFIYYLGYLYQKHETSIHKLFVPWKKNVIAIPSLIALAIVTYFLSLYNGRINMSTCQFQNYFIYLAVAILGIILYTVIARRIDKNRILETYCKLSLLMFGTQRILFQLYGRVQLKLGINLLDSTNILINILMISITLGIYYIYHLLQLNLVRKKEVEA